MTDEVGSDALQTPDVLPEDMLWRKVSQSATGKKFLTECEVRDELIYFLYAYMHSLFNIYAVLFSRLCKFAKASC